MTSLTYQSPLSPTREAQLRLQFTKRLAKQVRRLRTSQGMSQEEPALKAGLHPNYISDLERATRTPNVFTCWKIAHSLGLSFSEFWQYL